MNGVQDDDPLIAGLLQTHPHAPEMMNRHNASLDRPQPHLSHAHPPQNHSPSRVKTPAPPSRVSGIHSLPTIISPSLSHRNRRPGGWDRRGGAASCGVRAGPGSRWGPGGGSLPGDAAPLGPGGVLHIGQGRSCGWVRGFPHDSEIFLECRFPVDGLSKVIRGWF